METAPTGKEYNGNCPTAEKGYDDNYPHGVGTTIETDPEAKGYDGYYLGGERVRYKK